MKLLYLDCSMGAAGDMLSAALFDLLPDDRKKEVLKQMNQSVPEGVIYEAVSVRRCGVRGTRFCVRIHGEEEKPKEAAAPSAHPAKAMTMEKIRTRIDALAFSEQVRAEILEVYGRIAEAESHVHGVPVTEIHFHEVGMLDAIADVAAVSFLMQELAPDRVVASPVCTGSGTVHCAHGILPVPAPATAYLLRGVPVYAGSIQAELCTPTGAALLKQYVDDFLPMPMMQIASVGYGMGAGDFNALNAVRAFWGESRDAGRDEVVSLSCNLDDMTAEEIAFAGEQLREAGAVDVWTCPIQMKKNRLGTLLTVLCRKEDREQMLRRIFQHTSTLGIRESVVRRHIQNRREESVDTPFGPVRRKISEGYGKARSKWEYEDLANIARERDLSIDEVRSALNNPQQ